MTHAQHPHKFLPDGTLNPLWKPRASGKHPQRRLADGSPNPAWKPRSHGTAKARPLYARNFFIAWDGEGIDTPAGHQYKLLSCCWRTSKGWETRDLVAEEGQALRTEDIFAFMQKVQRELPKRGVHVIFSSAYDVTHILRDMSWIEAKYALVDTQKRRGWHGGYSVKAVMRKTLNVWFPRRMDKRKRPAWRDSLLLWDVWGFFQSSFIEAIERWLDKDSPDLDLALIQAGKAQRGKAADIEGLLTYCHAELRALVMLMEQVGSAFLQAGLHLYRWDGPGAAAAAAYREHMDKSWFEAAREPIEKTAALHDAVSCAYFGGRVEMIRYGIAREQAIWHYDLNSAYPAAIAQLPDLAQGTWRRGDGPPQLVAVNPMTLCHVRWDFSGKMLCPFPLRREGGRVAFPPRGEGWYWWPEVAAAQAAIERDRFKRATRWNYAACRVDIIEHWRFVPARGTSKSRPFAWVADLYARRREAHQAGQKGLSLVLKLALNSLYGKMAQQVGYVPRLEPVLRYETKQLTVYDNGVSRTPPFYNLVAAGWITSWCRAQLFTAAASKPRAVVMLATDGLITTEHLALEVDEDKRLGGWSRIAYGPVVQFVVVQSGVYYIQTKDGEWLERSRGFGFAAPPTQQRPGRSERIAERVALFEAAWRAGEKTVSIPTRRLVTLKAAAAGDTPSPQWEQRGEWAEVEGGRQIHLIAPWNSPKRMGGLTGQPKPYEGLVLTAPWEDFEDEYPLSLPYEALPMEQSDAAMGGLLEADIQDYLEHCDD